LIYLDNNATTQPLGEVAAAVKEALRGCWGNPSAAYGAGREARRALQLARAEIAALLAAPPQQVCLVSGGSEANALAIQGSYLPRRSARSAIVVGATEHPSVERAARYLEDSLGAEVRLAPVDDSGQVKLAALERLVDDRCALVSVMLANNITGAISDLGAIVAIARRAGALVHTDAVQVMGKLPLHWADLGVDLLSVSAHKLHGPKGIGALLIRQGIEVDPIVHGGGQEQGLRAGTENLVGAVGFGAAATIAARDLSATSGRVAALRDRLEAGLQQRISGLRFLSADVPRLPNTSCAILQGVDGAALLDLLDAAGLAASGGSACHASSPGPAPQLLAMGLSALEAQSALRLSLSRLTTSSEIDAALDIIADAVAQVRAEHQVPVAPPRAVAVGEA